MGASKEQALQFGLGEEFGGNPDFDGFTRKVLNILPNLDAYSPLAMPASLDDKNSSRGVMEITVFGQGRERKLTVLPDLRSFEEYSRENRIKGMIFIVPNLAFGKISFSAFEAMGKIFGSMGRVARPNIYKIWIVDQDAADLPVWPKSAVEEVKLRQKIETARSLGLVAVRYHHSHTEKLGWFEARLPKKRKVREKDVSEERIIIFLKSWAEKVAEFKGVKVVSTKALEERLRRSHSFLKSMQEAGDLDGVVLEESCGCKVKLEKGVETTVLSCNQENCLQKSAGDSKRPFRLGQKYVISPCGDCGGERSTQAYWAGNFDIKNGIEVYYQVVCKEYSSHGYRSRTWVDPARILNPLYIYYAKTRDRKTTNI